MALRRVLPGLGRLLDLREAMLAARTGPALLCATPPSPLPSLALWRTQGLSPSLTRWMATLSGSVGLTPTVEAQLARIAERHEELLAQLGGGAAAAGPGGGAGGGSASHQVLSPASRARLGKELSELEPVLEALGALQAKRAEVAELQELMEDAGEGEELRRLARDERAAAAAQLPELERTLLLRLLPRDEADERGVVLEVRAGTGGDEAALFAGELYRMYERYVALQGWRWEPLEATAGDAGGLKAASAAVSAPGGGGGVYGRLKFESGVHRVQRVPATESGGRVHTSAASVAVLPAAGELDVAIRDEDLRIDVYRSGGAGGQHVNTTNSAVRVTHLPTGVSVAIQDERSQHKNKAKALGVLRARLYEAERLRRQAASASERRGLIGSGDRSERIRTYNFPQGRVTDHRVGLTEHSVEGVLSGELLGGFIDAAQAWHQGRLLSGLAEEGA